MNKEAMRKLKMARKYQKEAFLELVPEKVRGNVQNIEKEMKEILLTLLVDSGMEFMQSQMEPASEKEEKTVKKVDIS